MVDVKQQNELYNCLDLYIVTSRVEVGHSQLLNAQQ